MEMRSMLVKFRWHIPKLLKTIVMAKKSKPRISPADVPPGMILVKSRAYGDHLRAKRGTHKKAKLNAALKKRTVFVREANAAAKLFRDAVQPYGKGIIDKSIWPNLLSMFLLQLGKIGKVDFSQLEPFELHSRYTLHKILPTQVVRKYDDKTRTLQAVMSYSGPHFRNTRIDGYKLTAVVLFPDLKKKTAKTIVEESPILSQKIEQTPFDMSVSVPPRVKCFMLCLRIDGYSTDKAVHTFATKGMKVIAAGTLARS